MVRKVYWGGKGGGKKGKSGENKGERKEEKRREGGKVKESAWGWEEEKKVNGGKKGTHFWSLIFTPAVAVAVVVVQVCSYLRPVTPCWSCLSGRRRRDGSRVGLSGH